jgi:hypothetical protein
MPSFDFRRAIPFIEAVPCGRWTSFSEVAAAAGNPKAFMAAGNQIRDSVRGGACVATHER